jgi:DNA-binding winged helix-turn-helix (wHTH) protein
MAETLQRQEVVRFGPFRLDLMNRLLYRDGVEVALPPRAVGVLWLLVSRAGQVVSRQELLERVWKDAFVSDTSLAEAISLVRQVLGDDAQQHVFIQTLPRRGYRFVAPVEPEHPDLAEAKTEPRAAAGPASATDVALWTPWLPYLLLFSTGLATGLFFVSRVQPSPQTSGGLVRLGIVLPDATLDTHGRPVAVATRSRSCSDPPTGPRVSDCDPCLPTGCRSFPGARAPHRRSSRQMAAPWPSSGAVTCSGRRSPVGRRLPWPRHRCHSGARGSKTTRLCSHRNGRGVWAWFVPAAARSAR